jgi:hypothetical protein
LSGASIREPGTVLRGDLLTHYSYSVHCSRIALELRRVAKVFVQIRKQGATLCGQVVSCEDFDGKEFFKVETQRGQEWAPASSTRLCSFDGRCTCEDAL